MGTEPKVMVVLPAHPHPYPYFSLPNFHANISVFQVGAIRSRNLFPEMLRNTRPLASAAAAADSFSFLACAQSSKLSSSFARPPNPPSSNSRNPSPFTTPAERTSSCPHNSPDERDSTARLPSVIEENMNFDDTKIQMDWLYSFNMILNWLAKNKRYSDVFWLYGRMPCGGLIPDFYTLSILLNCFCNVNRVRYAFAVMGSIVRKGYSPNTATFNSLIKGLFIGGRVDEADQLFQRLETFGCVPNVITCSTMIGGLCRSGHTSDALRLHEKMVSENGPNGIGCEPDVISYGCIIDGLCKERKEDKAIELFLEMQCRGLCPDIFVYTSLLNGLCSVGKWKEAANLFNEMLARRIQPSVVTLNVLMGAFCMAGKMEEADKLLEMMRQREIDSGKFTYDTEKDGSPEKHVRPNDATYNAMIQGLCKGGHFEKANDLFVATEDQGFSHSPITYNAILRGFAEKKQLENMAEIIHKMYEKKVCPDASNRSIVFDLLGKEDKYRKCLHLILTFRKGKTW